MARIQLLLAPSLCAGLLLCSCGESQDMPSRQNQTLGGIKEGAPLGPAVPDPGILQDATSYQPPKVVISAVAGGAPGVPVGARAREESGGRGPDAQVRAAVAALDNALKDGEVELALRAFSADQVKPLTEKIDFLFGTFEKLDALKRALAAKLDPTKAGPLLSNLRGAASAPKWEMIDAEHASVSPNLGAILFGPVKPVPKMQLALQHGEWKFQLDAPLTAAEVDAIVAFHQQLQTALGNVIAWVQTTPTVDEAQLQAALTKAILGQPVDLGSTGEKKPEEAAGAEPAPGPPSGGEEPPPPPKPGGGRSRPRGP